jgi:hypothetical protein
MANFRMHDESDKEKKSTNISGKDKFQLILESLNVVGKSIDAFNEFKKSEQETIRHKINADIRLKELDIQVKKIMSEERIKMAELKSNFILEMKKLDNEIEKRRLQKEILDTYFQYLNNLQTNYFEWKNKFGIEDPRLDKIGDNLHDAMMKLPHF